MMYYPAVTIFILLVASVRAQGIPRSFLARPYRGGPPVQVEAVLGGSAHLPCAIRSPQYNDSAVLVVWYKVSDESMTEQIPIYSYDLRHKLENQITHWKANEYNDRAHFDANTGPALLNIKFIEEKDEGAYLCRVDFHASPTKNSRIYLTVIIPPKKPIIQNEHGETVSTTTGIYREDGELRLTCIVSGGRPDPTVKWWKGETLLESKEVSSGGPHLKKKILTYTDLKRTDLHAEFTCQASNNNISQPVSASVKIEMDLRPLTVSILKSDNAPLSADREYKINCMTFGSRPPAKISWYIDGKLLKNFTQKFSEDGNMTSSTLTFKPSREDHEKVITCRAENPKLNGGVEEDTWKLNVFFLPTLKLQLGSKMNPDDIEEGDDVYFECLIRANPKAYKVVWQHNGQVLHNNAKKGIIVQQYSLALRKVDRSQAGDYMCVASNVEGDGFSDTVELKIMYKPICVADQKRIYGVAKHEEAKIVCRVDAYPLPDNFHWLFNNTEQIVEVSSKKYTNSTRLAQSILTYTPVSETDYGTVSCTAGNTAGQQVTACVFHIIAAGKPEAPYNCTITNQTSDSLSFECTAGFDGGQPQNFLLEVYDQHTDILLANVTSHENATFTVQDLQPDKVLTMKLYAFNSKGRSEVTKLEGFTLKVAEKQTGTPVPFEITPLLGVLIGVVAVLLFITIVILGALKVRSDRRAARPGDLPLKKANAPSSEDLYDADDRNPDVIPTNKDSDYQLTGSTAGTPLAAQPTPDEVSTTSLPAQQTNHLQNITSYNSHNDYTNYPTLPLSGEVTYAELCLARTTTDPKLTCINDDLNNISISSGLIGGKHYIKEATVYACIDHSAKPPKIDQICQPIKGSTGVFIQDNINNKQQLHHPREVVTVRTPLISTQESCV